MDKQVIMYLIEKGADVYAKNNKQQTPLDIAKPRIRGIIKATIEIMALKDEILKQDITLPNPSEEKQSSEKQEENSEQTINVNNLKDKIREETRVLLNMLDEEDSDDHDGSIVVENDKENKTG